MKFIKKPVVIEAYQTDVPLDIETLEGVMHASPGDWIITGVNGEKYPCKPDIFKKTYEPEKAWEGTNRDKQKSIIEKFSQFEQITGPNMPQCVTISAETVRDVLEVLKEQEVTPSYVVRCNECVYSRSADPNGLYCTHKEIGKCRPVKNYFFCAYGQSGLSPEKGPEIPKGEDNG